MKLTEGKRSPFLRGVFTFSTICLFISILYLLLQVYDNRFSKTDQLINGFAFRNILIYVFIVCLIFFLLYRGLTSRYKFVQNTALSLSAVVFLLLLLEVGAHILIRMEVFGKLEIKFRRFYIGPDVANREPLFWGDFSEATGRWRATNASYVSY
jgi:small-conductance mechanosensitive channel